MRADVPVPWVSNELHRTGPPAPCGKQPAHFSPFSARVHGLLEITIS